MNKGAYTQFECKYHVVLCRKYRKDVFGDKGIKEYTWELIQRISEEYEAEIEAMEIAEDHIHLLVGIPPKMSVAEFIRITKSISAREIFKRFPSLKKRLWSEQLWKDGYFVSSVGSGVTKEMVRKYIDADKEKEEIQIIKKLSCKIILRLLKKKELECGR